MIRARGLRRAYGSRVALDGVDLDVAAGEVLGLLGSNGAGKTTLLSILAGALPPSAGDAEVAGASVATTPREARRRVGLVPQGGGLYPLLTVEENARFFGRLHGLGRSEARERAAKAIGDVGLAPRAGARAASLSGGLRQRASLACALVHDPPVLLLDEPTSALDPAARRHVWALLRDLSRARGKTLVVTTHGLEEARALCDRVAFLERGRLVATVAASSAADLEALYAGEVDA